ncbi:uncharacterized protein K02A2.6-like [Eupeodes corollae]|uniref:uncharacterized protein K02A2.6-like n=1 Tax=Eupeodes corollae TaxID=290404 RepID=UPI002490DBC4|nr:uncharacterized protein K02A2.6-like [Eupeodes corollae]
MKPRIIAYGNKCLSDCEKRYCQTEKEALALVWGVEHFHIYLYGLDFELVTDHKPLETIFGLKSKPCARIERWVLRLQSYRYKIIYKPGKSNIADPLSRLCIVDPIIKKNFDSEEHVHHIASNSVPKAFTLKEIDRISENDQEILRVKEGMYEQNWNKDVLNFKVFENELCFYGNILLRQNKIVIPQQLRKKVIEFAHEGHPGIVGTKRRLRTKVWWPKIDQDAENIVRNCRGCLLVSAPTVPEPMKRRTMPTAPWVDIAIDLMGPLPSDEHLFVVVDYYSRYKEIVTLKNITSTSIIKSLRKMFSRLGYPQTITADNGKQFSSKEFRDFCEEFNVKLYNTIPYWPQQYGEVERQNRDILKRIKISKATGSNWKEDLIDYLLMYHHTPHSTTGKAPAKLFYGRLLKDKIPSLINQDQGFNQEFTEKDAIEKEKGKLYADKKRRAAQSELTIGDQVLVKKMRKENKIDSNFGEIPHEVIKQKGGDVLVKNSTTGEVTRRNIVHLKKINGNWTIQTNKSNSFDDSAYN